MNKDQLIIALGEVAQELWAQADLDIEMPTEIKQGYKQGIDAMEAAVLALIEETY